MHNVVYDLSNLRSPITGIGRYALEVVSQGVKSKRPVSAFINNQILTGDALLLALESLSVRVDRSGASTRATIGRFPFARTTARRLQAHRFIRACKRAQSKPELYHNVSYAHPLGVSAASLGSITTVFDLSHLYAAQTHPRHRVRFLQTFLQRLTHQEGPIITISESVKHELCEHLCVSPERVWVTPLGADQAFAPVGVDRYQTVLDHYGLKPKQFVLCVGTLEPRKNLSRVIAAHQQLGEPLRRQFPLVLAGGAGWKNAALEQLIDSEVKAGFLHRLGYVPLAHLPSLYSAARVFVYPSIYEGFGLPVLEAMQCACPVITSDRGALNELAGGAAWQVTPENLDQLVAALQQLIDNDAVCTTLSEDGQTRSRNFSWESTLEQTWRAYESL